MRYLAGTYALSAALGTVLAIRRNEPAAPFGEPSTWRWKARSNGERAGVVANLAIPALMWVRSRNVFGTLDR